MKLYFCFIFCTFVQCQNAQEPSAATKANLDEAFTLMAQPIFQEPPPAFSHSSASYWNNPSAYETGAEVCIETHNDFVEARDHLFHVKETLLDRIECGMSNGYNNCTKLIISSIGKSLVRHPPRFGLYSLETVFEGYPAYTRNASQQSLFYKEEYEKWIYAHKFERWVIGPQIGDENGGFVMLSEEVCPWNIDFDETDMYYYDKLVYNTWNPVGNGWRSENGMIAIECYDSDKYPLYSCGCNVVNVTSDGGRISEYHPQKLGLYHIVPHTSKIGFLAPVYKKEGKPAQYLYSHHHEGRFWLLGQSYTSWSIRLDLISKFRDDIIIPPEDQYQGVTKHGSIGAFCPMQKPPKGTVWEYLQGRNGEDEIWLKDEKFRIRCVG